MGKNPWKVFMFDYRYTFIYLVREKVKTKFNL